MKNKVLLLASSIITASLAIGAIVINNSSKELKRSDSLPTTYTLTLNSSNQLVDETPNNEEGDKYGKVHTDLGAEIHMRYSKDCITGLPNDFIMLTAQDYFYNTVPLNGLIKMDYSIKDKVTLDYGFAVDDVYGGYELGTNGQTTTSTLVFDDYEGIPSFFRFTSTYGCTITSLTFYYSCIPSPNPHRIDGEWEYEFNSDLGANNSITLTGYSIDDSDIPEDKSLVVPSDIDGYVVTRINEGCIADAYWVKNIILPFIGTNRYLNKADNHYSFGSIWGNDKEHLMDPNYRIITQKEADDGDFISWIVPLSLKNIYIQDGNESVAYKYDYTIPDYAFYGGDFIENIVINAYLINVGKYAFASCSKIKELTLPDSTASIGVSAFANMQRAMIRSLGNIAITDAMNPYHCPVSEHYVDTIVRNGVMYDVCGNNENRYLNAIGLENKSTTYIDLGFFYYYDAENIRVKRIANRAFQQESSIRTVEISSVIEYVGYNAFRDCYKASLFVYNEPTSNFKEGWNIGVGEVFTNYIICGVIGDYHTADLSDGLGSDVIIDIDNKENYVDLDLRGLINYNLHPDAYLYTAAYFFEGCEYVETLRLPKNVDFGKYSFYNCPNLTTVYYDGYYVDFDNVAYNHMGVNTFSGTQVVEVICINGARYPINV